ncbi:hypothetical protein AAG570_006815 [Ranatra chinensis]|uniref:Uncharacterized protein n=1 Tax=Ranatra chinensis TaxID=642074 RepID=A0ABD0ZGE5_9HEMI
MRPGGGGVEAPAGESGRDDSGRGRGGQAAVAGRERRSRHAREHEREQPAEDEEKRTGGGGGGAPLEDEDEREGRSGVAEVARHVALGGPPLPPGGAGARPRGGQAPPPPPAPPRPTGTSLPRDVPSGELDGRAGRRSPYPPDDNRSHLLNSQECASRLWSIR